MPEDASTWIVMLRDLSAAVQVRGEATVLAGLVLEAQSGMVLAAKVAIVGISGEIIAGVGLREHWPREAPEADGRRGR